MCSNDAVLLKFLWAIVETGSNVGLNIVAPVIRLLHGIINNIFKMSQCHKCYFEAIILFNLYLYICSILQ